MAWLNSDLAPGVDTAAIDDIRNTDWMQPAASQLRNFGRITVRPHRFRLGQLPDRASKKRQAPIEMA